MTELNEQQEQEMIERAKAGDPEANYKMSLWALEQAMAEPDEERWNRLAAKCLVKASEAGYEPAKAKMAELLQAAEAKTAAQGKPSAARPDQTVSPAEAPAAPQLNKVAEQAGAAAKKAGAAAGKAAVKAGSALAAGASSLAKKAKDGIAKSAQAKAAAAENADADKTAADGADANTVVTGGSHTRKKASILPDFSQWDDAKWKKMQIACVIVCVILALLIAVLVITGRGSKTKEAPEGGTTQIPAAEIAATPEPESTDAPAPAVPDETEADATVPGGTETEATTTPEATTAPEATPYPSQDVRDEIASAGLDVRPEDGDYVDGPKTVTVATQGSSLNMRRGPGSNYNLVGAMPNGTQVSVYANKNGWGLVQYEGIWGWCSYDYLAS